MNKNEFEFQHRRGNFRGYVMRKDGKLIQVKMTTNQPAHRRVPEYWQGELRWISEDTPRKETGRRYPDGVVQAPEIEFAHANATGIIVNGTTWEL